MTAVELVAIVGVFLLVLAAGGAIADRLVGDEREDAWRRNHSGRWPR